MSASIQKPYRHLVGGRKQQVWICPHHHLHHLSEEYSATGPKGGKIVQFLAKMRVHDFSKKSYLRKICECKSSCNYHSDLIYEHLRLTTWSLQSSSICILGQEYATNNELLKIFMQFCAATEEKQKFTRSSTSNTTPYL